MAEIQNFTLSNNAPESGHTSMPIYGRLPTLSPTYLHIALTTANGTILPLTYALDGIIRYARVHHQAISDRRGRCRTIGSIGLSSDSFWNTAPDCHYFLASPSFSSTFPSPRLSRSTPVVPPSDHSYN